MSAAYRFYVIGDGDRILANELAMLADDAAARLQCGALLTRTEGARAVEAWEHTRLVHRHE